MGVRRLWAATAVLAVVVLIALAVFVPPAGESGNSDDLVAGADLGPARVLAATAVAQPTPTVPAAPVEPTPTPEPTLTPLATATPEPRELTISFSGDILSHMPVVGRAQAYGNSDLPFDYRPMFDLVRPRLQAADLAICVLETPLSSDNGDLSGYPSFNAPGDLADALADAGFDACSTASNHSLDRGESGVNETLDELDRVGVRHAGMARTSEEHDEPRLYDVNGVQVAHLSFTYGLNGYVRPEGKEWMVDVTDPALVLAAAARAREAGAEIVVLMIQWGNEYVTDPTAEQLSLAAEFAASEDIDLIVGNHAHVVQPIDRIGETTVVYGLGNFLSNQPAAGYPARTQDGMIVEVHFAEDTPGALTVDSVTVVPTWVDRSTFVIVPVQSALEDEAVANRPVLETSLARTVDAVSSLGYAVTFD